MEKLKRISCFILKTVFIALLLTTGMIISNFQFIKTPVAQNTTPIVEQVKTSESVFDLWNKAITVRAVDLQKNLVIRHRTVFRGRIEARGGIWSELEIFEGTDGRLYKCVDPFVAPASGTFTKESIPDTYHFATINRTITFTPELKDKLALINYFGDQETPGLDRSVYTNLMVWDTLLPDYYGEHTRFVDTPPEINITAYNNFKNEVNEKIRKYKVMPSFDNTTVTLRVGESKIIEDTNAVLDTVRVNDSNGFTFEKLDNRRLKVIATANATSARLRFRKNIDPSKQYQSVFYHKPGSQKMGLFGVADPLHASVSFNVQKLGRLELLKIDGENTNKKLQNAVFELLKDNRVIATATSNAEGKVLFNDLLPGDYVVREKTAPTGYRLNTNTLNVTVQPGQTNRQNFSNFKIRGNIEVIKQDGEQHSTKLQGAVFELKQGNTVVATATANAQGVARFTNVAYGSYTIVEKTAPTGYRLNPNTLNVTVSEHQRTYQLAFNNFKIKGNVEVLKVDAEDNNVKLPGITFELLKNGNEVATAITDTNGIARFTNIEYGTYEIQEKATLENYVLSTIKYPVNIQQHNQTVNITAQNQKIKGNIEVLKVDAEDNNVKLPGITFALLKDGHEVATAITDTSGIARFTNVEYGAYEVQEKATLENYVLSSTKYPVNIQQHNQTVNITAQNQRIKGLISIQKFAAHDRNIKLQGVVFNLLNTSDEIVATATTDTEGKAVFRDVEYGEYTIVEAKTAEGYFLTQIKHKVRVYEHNQEIAIQFENEKEPVIQTQAHGKDLQPQELVEPKEKQIITEIANLKDLVIGENYKVLLELVDLLSKKVVQTREVEFIATANEMTITENFEVNGFIYTEGITFSEDLLRKNKNGEYVLKSTHNKEYDDKEQTVKFKKYGSIEVKKIDSQDGQLIQATMKFGLFKNGELIEEVLTKEGVAKFNTKLIIDPKIVYEVKELEAPERYMKSEEILKVVLTEDDAHQVKVFSYNNTLLPVVKITPPTNDSTNTFAYGSTMLIALIGMLLLRRKQD